MRILRPTIFALKEGLPLMPDTFPIGAQFIVPQNILTEKKFEESGYPINIIALTKLNTYKPSDITRKILVDGRGCYNDRTAEFLNLVTGDEGKQFSVIWNIHHDATFAEPALHGVHTHFTEPLNLENVAQVTTFYQSFSKLRHQSKPFIGISMDCGKEERSDYAKAHTAITLARTLNKEFSGSLGITAAISGVNAVEAQHIVDYFAYLNSKGATNYGIN